jgi:FdhD protein
MVYETSVVNESGEVNRIFIPAERALTVYVDKRELVTLMTLGVKPEMLVLGFLRNQRLVTSVDDIESISVDWEIGAAAVNTRQGISDIDLGKSSRIVTTGCGQGSVFDNLMDVVDGIKLPAVAVSKLQIHAIVDTVRLKDTIYKTSGSVHGCALFSGDNMLIYVEDVGRHNAIDTIGGWTWLQEPAMMAGSKNVFYTTGRLTSEMIIKAAQMGVPTVMSRSGITQMGLELAQRLGMCAIGRAINKRFLCYSGGEFLQIQSDLKA